MAVDGTGLGFYPSETLVAVTLTMWVMKLGHDMFFFGLGGTQFFFFFLPV
jgi:hypothetical protein